MEEVNIFPPLVASVATAIPAFVGHTQLIVDADGNSLVNVPVRLSSMLEFTTIFGSAYNPSSYTLQVDPASGFSIIGVTPVNGNKFYLFDALQHYFDNGGGSCYVVTAGDFRMNVIYGTDATGLRGGLRSLEKLDEPTILAIPDTVALKQSGGAPDFIQAGNLHKDMIDQCARLQDRFCILDIVEGYRAPNDTTAPVNQFRTQVGTQNLNYAASYYPWLNSNYIKAVRFSQLKFVDNQSPPVAIPDSTIDTLTGNALYDAMVTNLRSYNSEEQRIFSKITSPALNRTNYNTLSTQFILLKSAVMTVTTAAAVRPLFAALMSFVRQLALSFEDIRNDIGNSAALTKALAVSEADTSLQSQLTLLIAFEKNANVMNSISTTRAAADVETDYASLSSEGWIGGVTVGSISPDATDFTNSGANTIAQTAQAAANALQLQTAFNTISQAYTSFAGAAIFRTDQAEKILFAQHPFFKSVYERVIKEMSQLPPSGAVTGVYVTTDRTRGVWKAPANVSLRSVISPAYKLNDAEQGALNVHDTGKSVNAIRAFTGKGNIVWGARTLSGNDTEWRYINVRRFFTYVEESTKKASQQFIFEQNDANTWIRIRAMIDNFLTTQWRQGALFGTTPKDAFFVKVGLNETMTAQDILEGRLIVEIGLAAVRPAEFIVLRFSHKMQES